MEALYTDKVLNTEQSLWSNLRGNRVAFSSLIFLAVVVALALVAPFFIAESYKLPSDADFVPPLTKVVEVAGTVEGGVAEGVGQGTGRYLFGTDINGKDLFYKVVSGARVSLLVGIAGALVSLLIGTFYGVVAGFAPKKIGEVMMRVVDVLQSVPRLLFLMIFIAAFDSRLRAGLDTLRLWAQEQDWGLLQNTVEAALPYSRIGILILSLGLIEWLTMARIIRGQVLVLREQSFVKAARVLGQKPIGIIAKHILPNLATVILTYMTLTIPAVILDESFLSFLGLGIDDPASSWGSLLRDGAEVINPVKSHWWLLVFPAVFMAGTLLALNFLGDGLRDILDPRTRN